MYEINERYSIFYWNIKRRKLQINCIISLRYSENGHLLYESVPPDRRENQFFTVHRIESKLLLKPKKFINNESLAKYFKCC